MRKFKSHLSCMPLVARLLLILLVWSIAALVCRSAAPRQRNFLIDAVKHSSAHEAKPCYREEFVNDSQKLPFVHVASIMELKDHTLAALWYGGPYEYNHKNTIFMAKLRTDTWQEPLAIVTPERAQHDLERPFKCLGNPLMLSNPDGSLRLLFVTIAMGKWSGSQLNTCLSMDGGLSWSPAERLTLSPLFNLSELVRNRPVPLEGGGWCVPIYQEFLGKFPELLWLNERHGTLDYQKTRIAGGCSSLQPSLIPLEARRAIVLLRDYTSEKRIFITRTEDGGHSWSRPAPTFLPNPDAGISGLRLSDGRILVAYNDSTEKRDTLSLALSKDEGRSWQQISNLENDPYKSFSYPYLIQSSDGIVHLAYTWNSTLIKMISFNEEWITAQAAENSEN